MVKKRVDMIVKGRVQGVCFRSETKRQGRILNLTGFVRNKDDGDVEVVAEGEEKDIKELVKYCRKGPLGARVDNLDVKFGKNKDEFKFFEIRY